MSTYGSKPRDAGTVQSAAGRTRGAGRGAATKQIAVCKQALFYRRKTNPAPRLYLTHRAVVARLHYIIIYVGRGGANTEIS